MRSEKEDEKRERERDERKDGKMRSGLHSINGSGGQRGSFADVPEPDVIIHQAGSDGLGGTGKAT